MRWDIVKTLFHFHLYYTNTKLVQNLRKNYQNISDKLIQKYKQYKLLRILGSGLIGYILSIVTHGSVAGYVAFCILVLSFLSLNDTVYSLFYESKDSLMLLNLPIYPKELFVAKTMLIMENLIELFTILFAYLATSLFLYQNASIIQLVCYFIICILLALFILFVAVLLNSLLVQTNFFRKNIVLFRSIKTIFISLLSCAGYLINRLHLSFIQLRDPLVILFKPSNYFTYFLNTVVLVVLNAILYWIIHHYFSTQYLKHMQELKPLHQKRTKQSKTLVSLLIRRNLNLLKNQTVISTALSPSITFFVLLFLNAKSLGTILTKHPEFYVYGYTILFMFALTFISESSFSAVSQSLEQEQWLYIKTLPIDLKQYLSIKFLTASTLQNLLYSLVFIVYFIYVGFNIVQVILSIILFNIVAYGKSLWMFQFDYKHLMLNCSSYADLYNRSDKLFAIVLYILKIISLLLLVGVLVVILNSESKHWITALIFLTAISYTLFAYTKTRYIFQQT